MPFYITLRRRKDPELQASCAYELHQATILRRLRVVQTSYDQMVNPGHGLFGLSQNNVYSSTQN